MIHFKSNFPYYTLYIKKHKTHNNFPLNQDEHLAAERERKKAEEEAAAKAAAAAKAYKPIKKVEKKEPQPSPEQSIGSDESMYKLPKKKPSIRYKYIQHKNIKFQLNLGHQFLY